MEGFIPDAVGVLEATVDRVLARIHRPTGRPPRQRREEPHGVWKQEARAWLDPLARRHAS
jgi:hypothetical protein